MLQSHLKLISSIMLQQSTKGSAFGRIKDSQRSCQLFIQN
jgi:hypothetical protein